MDIKQTITPDFSSVTEFEKKIADFFGAPYAVAVDSCTHGIELCLRLTGAKEIECPTKTYLSIPMLSNKLNIKLNWWHSDFWTQYYCLSGEIYDAATLWGANTYWPDSFMCLSFQYQKHLSLGRGGMILCPDEQSYNQLKKMSYDGRLPGIPWREQDIDTMGYHYYMTPETAQKGLTVLDEAIRREPRIWSYKDYPDVSQMKVFKSNK